MTAGHLITNRNLTLLSDIDPYGLVYARSQLITVFSCKYLGINDDSVCAVRYLKGCITNLSCLLTEDRTEKSFLCRKLCLSLRSHLSDKDITGTHLCTDADDSALVQIL